MKNTWRFAGNELQYIKEVIDSGFGSSTSGSMNNRFETAFAEAVESRFAVTFNSGTSTLHAALHACGVQAGDEVIIPSLTVISNIYVILAQNAVPVFADIDPRTFNISSDSIKERITEKTKAIMPVPLYGLSCDFDAINEVARPYGIKVINDAAQAFGALYKGKVLTKCADISSYSLENSKHITTGDGGIVVTDKEEYAIKMRKFGSLGYAAMKSGDGRIRVNKDIFQAPEYKRHDSFGYNYRMPEVAAALGLAQVERIEFFINLRRDIAKMYDSVCKESEYLIPQYTPSGYKHSYWTYAVRYENSDVPWKEFRKKYEEFGGDGIYAAWALSYLETYIASGDFKKLSPYYFSNIDYGKGLCPVAEKLQPQIMQFVTNYGSLDDAKPKVDALAKTIQYFG